MNSLWWSLWWLLSPFYRDWEIWQHEGYVCPRRACGLGTVSVKTFPIAQFCISPAPGLKNIRTGRIWKLHHVLSYSALCPWGLECSINSTCGVKAWVITQLHSFQSGFWDHLRTTEVTEITKAILLQAYYVIGTVVRALRTSFILSTRWGRY